MDRTRRGFTLIEVRAMVVILSIASAIVVPQIATQNDLVASASARVIVSDLTYAQNLAIANQTKTYVVFDVVHQTYGFYSAVSPTAVSLTHPVINDEYVMNFTGNGPNSAGSTVLASANFGGQATLAFDEMGIPYSVSGGSLTALSSTGTAVVNSGNYSVTISVAPNTGEISAQ